MPPKTEPKTDIEIGIIVESLSDHFLISPNDLHRGTNGYAGLTLLERGMLSALLTFRPGNGKRWAASRADINALAPELGRDKISSILRGLREKRYLYTRRVNAGYGRLRWEWRVYMTAQSPGFDPFPPAITTTAPTIDGTTIDGEAVTVDEQRKDGILAGHTIDGSSGTSTTSLKEVPTQEVPKKKSPLPPTPPAPAITAGPKMGGEEINEETAVNGAIVHQPTWRPVAVRAALRQAIAKGLPADVAYRVIVDLARGDTYGPTTAGPQRIIAHGPWWTPGAVFVAAAPKDTKPMCGRHLGQIAATCSACAGERNASTKPPVPPKANATSAPEDVRAMFARIPALQRARAIAAGQQQPTPSHS